MEELWQEQTVGQKLDENGQAPGDGIEERPKRDLDDKSKKKVGELDELMTQINNFLKQGDLPSGSGLDQKIRRYANQLGEAISEGQDCSESFERGNCNEHI